MSTCRPVKACVNEAMKVPQEDHTVRRKKPHKHGHHAPPVKGLTMTVCPRLKPLNLGPSEAVEG